MDGLAERNIETWTRIISFYEHSFAGTWYEQLLQPLLLLVKQLAQTDRAKFFRAGQSIYNLIISTVDYWGLKDENHFVIVEPLNPDFQRFRVQYRDYNQIFESHTCDPANLRSIIEPMLDRLWVEAHNRRANS